MGFYVNKLAEIIAEAKAKAEQDEQIDTYARAAIYHEDANGENLSVTVDGYKYDCSIASLDLVLVDGCRVMVMPDHTGNTMVIVGGGLP